jgi:hypothetical protein
LAPGPEKASPKALLALVGFAVVVVIIAITWGNK